MTAAATEYRTISQPDLLALLRERFGPDPGDWAFVCPQCGDVATGREFSHALASRAFTNSRTGENLQASDMLGQFCIGRLLGALDRLQTIAAYRADPTTRGCDWVAFGLFQGPWAILLPDGRSVPSFAPAPAPPSSPE
jgi:hypothetical protein